MTTPNQPHHHGNLREALIAAGLDLIRETGLAGMTLRKAAARAGVSHAAPAHHFDGLPGLLTAVAAQAFDLFTGSMNAARRKADSAPLSQLRAICHGYLAFAAENAGLFQLMFVTPGLHLSDPQFVKSSNAAYQILQEGCAAFTTPQLAKELETAVWSLVHGYAMLAPGLAFDPNHPPASFDNLLLRLLNLRAPE